MEGIKVTRENSSDLTSVLKVTGYGYTAVIQDGPFTAGGYSFNSGEGAPYLFNLDSVSVAVKRYLLFQQPTETILEDLRRYAEFLAQVIDTLDAAVRAYNREQEGR